jgi:hypothetical protein
MSGLADLITRIAELQRYLHNEISLLEFTRHRRHETMRSNEECTRSLMATYKFYYACQLQLAAGHANRSGATVFLSAFNGAPPPLKPLPNSLKQALKTCDWPCLRDISARVRGDSDWELNLFAFSLFPALFNSFGLDLSSPHEGDWEFLRSLRDDQQSSAKFGKIAQVFFLSPDFLWFIRETTLEHFEKLQEAAPQALPYDPVAEFFDSVYESFVAEQKHFPAIIPIFLRECFGEHELKGAVRAAFWDPFLADPRRYLACNYWSAPSPALLTRLGQQLEPHSARFADFFAGRIGPSPPPAVDLDHDLPLVLDTFDVELTHGARPAPAYAIYFEGQSEFSSRDSTASFVDSPLMERLRRMLKHAPPIPPTYEPPKRGKMVDVLRELLVESAPTETIIKMRFEWVELERNLKHETVESVVACLGSRELRGNHQQDRMDDVKAARLRKELKAVEDRAAPAVVAIPKLVALQNGKMYGEDMHLHDGAQRFVAFRAARPDLAAADEAVAVAVRASAPHILASIAANAPWKWLPEKVRLCDGVAAELVRAFEADCDPLAKANRVSAVLTKFQGILIENLEKVPDFTDFLRDAELMLFAYVVPPFMVSTFAFMQDCLAIIPGRGLSPALQHVLIETDACLRRLFEETQTIRDFDLWVSAKSLRKEGTIVFLKSNIEKAKQFFAILTGGGSHAVRKVLPLRDGSGRAVVLNLQDGRDRSPGAFCEVLLATEPGSIPSRPFAKWFTPAAGRRTELPLKIVAYRADIVDQQAIDDASAACVCVRVDGRGEDEVREEFEQALRRGLGRVIQFR